MKPDLRLAVIVGLSVALCAATAGASVIQFQLNQFYRGEEAPGGIGDPWLTVVIDDEGTAGSVKVTFEATNLVDDEFVRRFYLNFNPGKDVGALTISHQSGAEARRIRKDTDGHQASALANGGFFDILLDFHAQDESKRFGVGMSSEYLVEGDGITALDFDYMAVGRNHRSAATIFNVGDIDEDAWVAAPEPSSLLLLSIGFPAIALARRRLVRTVST